MKTSTLDLRRMDCMDMMREFPDKHFDLAIVDPPYGIGAASGTGKYGREKYEAIGKRWDDETPSKEYFDELCRVSNEQIVWGGNYFVLRPSRCFIVWDKGEGFKDRDFAEAEQAWCSIDRNALIFKRDPLARGDYRCKIHPTQKPVALYRWLLSKFAKPGQRILDTHLGSGSIAIACHYFGAHLTGCEIDQDYFTAACGRIERETAQATFGFDTTQKLPLAPDPNQGMIF